jgi:hypothetical protein
VLADGGLGGFAERVKNAGGETPRLLYLHSNDARQKEIAAGLNKIAQPVLRRQLRSHAKRENDGQSGTRRARKDGSNP